MAALRQSFDAHFGGDMWGTQMQPRSANMVGAQTLCRRAPHTQQLRNPTASEPAAFNLTAGSWMARSIAAARGIRSFLRAEPSRGLAALPWPLAGSLRKP